MTGGLQRQFVAVSPKTKKTAICNITEIAGMSKLLPRKRVAQVDFDKRNLNRQECIAQRNTGVCECPWIQNYEGDLIGGCFLHPVNEFVLGVALKALKLVSKFAGDLDAACFDVCETRCAINLGLT
jgi:hypothetical protein